MAKYSSRHDDSATHAHDDHARRHHHRTASRTAADAADAATELLVQDGLLALPCAPQAMVVTRHLVWLALARDGAVQVRNAYTSAVVCTLHTAATATATTPQLPAPVRAMCATTTRRNVPYVWLGLGNGDVHVRHAVTTALRATLHAHTTSVTAIAEFGGLVYTASEDAQIVQWHSTSCALVRVVAAPHHHPRHTPPHMLATTRYALPAVAIANAADTNTTAASPTHMTSSSSRSAAAVRCLYAEGGALVSGGDDGVVRVWDVGVGAVQRSGAFHAGHGVTALCRVGVTVWSGDAHGTVVVWRLRTCEVVRTTALHHRCRITTLQKVGARVYSGAADGVVCICDAHTGDVLQRVSLFASPDAAGSGNNNNNDNGESGGRSGGGDGVVLLACPVRLSRFVLWSAGGGNNSDNSSSTTRRAEVRCWHHDEHVCMTADHTRLDELTWYTSGSTPYAELAHTLEREGERLRAQLASTGATAATAAAACLDGDHTSGEASLSLLLQPSRAQPLPTSTLPASADDRRGRGDYVDVYTPTAAADHAVVASPARDTATRAAALAPRQALLDTRARAAEARAAAAEAALRACAEDDARLQRELDDATAQLDAALRSLRATAPAAAEQLLSSAPFAPTATANSTATAATTATTSASAAASPPPRATTTTATSSPPPPAAASPALSTLAAPTAAAAATSAPTAGSNATKTAAPLATAPASLSPPPPPAATAAATTTTASAEAAGLAAVARVLDASWNGVAWTNPNVGNYIQRRYYGAQPSLRTPDLRARQRRRTRLPDVKLQPLPTRPRSRTSSSLSSSSPPSRDTTAAPRRAATSVPRSRATSRSDDASTLTRPRTTAAVVTTTAAAAARPRSALASRS